MSYASATKEQLRAWKAASGGDEGRILENVQLKIEKSKVDVQASLIATDGYYLIRRDIDAELGAKTHQMNIPRKAMQAAEKSMGKNDRAYFEDGRITVRTGTPEMFADLDSPVKIIIPFAEQTARYPRCRWIFAVLTRCCLSAHHQLWTVTTLLVGLCQLNLRRNNNAYSYTS